LKKRVAILVPGGLGGRDSGIHIPTLYRLVELLSQHFEIIAYSHRLPSDLLKTTFCGNARVRFLNATHESNSFVRAKVFVNSFLQDHEREKFHLVHGFWGLPFGTYAIVLGRTAGIPSVVTLLGGETARLPALGYGVLRNPLKVGLLRWACRNATVVTVQSEQQFREAKHAGIRTENMRVIPHGTSVDWPSTRRNGKAKREIRFLSVGDLSETKGLSILLKTFSAVRQRVPARLRLVGRNHSGEQLFGMLRDYGITADVDVRGFLAHRALRAQYSWADCFLQASWHEGGGAAVLEAATAGLLLCGTRTGFMADLADRGAVVADCGDWERLASEVVEAIRHPKSVNALTTYARKWARERSDEWSARTMLTLYEELLRARDQRR
jgi:glycosyltransferase involved in cell wall biosynthesis